MSDLTAPAINIAAQIDHLGNTAVVIKMQRDALADVLRDIAMGAEIMLQPGIKLSADLERFALEVQRVARAGLKEARV